MSLRTFARRFDDEVGLSPRRRLVQQRVSRARHLLESTDLPVDEIVGHVGFATARHCAGACTCTRTRTRTRTRRFGVPPLTCRHAFRAGTGTLPPG